MIENLALIIGVFSVVCSIFTMVVMLLLKKNVTDILNKDALVFDKNFEIKKNAINASLNIMDELEKYGKVICLNETFMQKAKQCYNDLLCVASDITLVEVFHSIAIDPNYQITKQKLNAFRLLCRKDMGLKVRITNEIQTNNETGANEAILKANAISSYETQNFAANTSPNAVAPQSKVQEQAVYTSQPVNNAEPVTEQAPTQTQVRPVSQQQRVQPASRPVQQRSATNVNRTTTTQTRPVSKPTNPNGTANNN